MKQKLLFTGASGFLGKNIISELTKLYQIKTLGVSDNDNYIFDIGKEVPLLEAPLDIVLHAAGKAHSIPKNQAEKKEFFDVNYQGTINLCSALEKSGIPKSFVFISTVAVYGVDFGENITEEHSLNGNTPYALSKIQAEKFLIEWSKKHNVTLGIIRPSLIAGPNPPGNLGAMIKAIKQNKYLSISGGKAKKSVLMVQDITNILPELINKGGVYNVCDDAHPSFRELELLITQQLGKSKPITIPFWLAKIMAKLGDLYGEKAPINSEKLKKITKSLTFSNQKAKKELDWNPIHVLENFKID